MARVSAPQGIGIEAEKLRSLAEDLQNLASALNLRFPVEDCASPANDLSEYARIEPDDLPQITDLARRFYRSRRMRSRIFGDEQLFGEPAWDLLLDLFVAQAEGKHLSVTAACIGAAVPTSTALRWLLILEERGLVRRENDPADARRVFLELTGDGFGKVIAYFRELLREGIAS